MRKYAKIAFLMALALSATAVFAACDNGGGNPWEEGIPQTPAQQEEEANNVLYKERLDKWLQYIEYEAPSSGADNKQLSALTERVQSDSDGSVSANRVNEKIYNTSQYTKGEYVQTWENKYYLAGTHENFLSFTTYQYDRTYNDDSKVVFADSTKKPSDEVRYSVNLAFHTHIMEVTKTSYALKETALDDTLVESYDVVLAYSYYDKNTGKAILLQLRGLDLM